MAKSLTIKITSAVLAKAKAADSSMCMIAMAIRDAGGRSTHITSDTVTFLRDGERFTYPLPARAAIELLKFDKDKASVKPFLFVLDGRTASVRPTVKQAPRRKPAKAATKTRVPVRRKPKARRTKHRFRGLRAIEVVRA